MSTDVYHTLFTTVHIHPSPQGHRHPSRRWLVQNVTCLNPTRVIALHHVSQDRTFIWRFSIERTYDNTTIAVTIKRLIECKEEVREKVV